MAVYWGEKRYHSLDYYLKNTYGSKLYKLSLNGGMTCPNRDGTCGTRGCIFCSQGGSGDFAESPSETIREQIEHGKSKVAAKYGGGSYIAYFQAYTNTYAPVDYLRKIFTEAIMHPDIRILSVATRPDCLGEDILNLLHELNQIKPVWIELGLQTIHEDTASYIRRGYDLPVFEHALKRLRQLGIPVIVAFNKSDINEKKGTQINEALLSEKLGCPVIKTTSTTDTGLKDFVAAAAELEGKGQVPPYVQGNINLHDKTEVEAADRKRFDFVNGIVKEVEVRKVQTKEKTKGDAIDKVLTNPVSGLIIFAAIMYLVFFISQSTLGTYLADILTGWIETFQEWVGGLLENANPFLYALLVDGIIGGVGAGVGFLPVVLVMYFAIALLEDCG